MIFLIKYKILGTGYLDKHQLLMLCLNKKVVPKTLAKKIANYVDDLCNSITNINEKMSLNSKNVAYHFLLLLKTDGNENKGNIVLVVNTEIPVSVNKVKQALTDYAHNKVALLYKVPSKILKDTNNSKQYQSSMKRFLEQRVFENCALVVKRGN